MQNKDQTEEKCERCSFTEDSFNCLDCGKSRITTTVSPSPHDVWEKELVKEFPSGLHGAEWEADGHFKCCWSEMPSVKSFIAKHITLARESERERIREMLEEKHIPTEHSVIFVEGYKEAIKDVLSLLSQSKEEKI